MINKAFKATTWSITTSGNPFDLVDWSVTKYITFDVNKRRIQCFSEIPILSFRKDGEYYASAANGNRGVLGYITAYREHMEEEFPNLINSLPVYYFDEYGNAKAMEVLSFEEGEIEHTQTFPLLFTSPELTLKLDNTVRPWHQSDQIYGTVAIDFTDKHE